MFWQFSNMIIYVKIVVKIPNQHLYVWFFSNPGDKVSKKMETFGTNLSRTFNKNLDLVPWIGYNHTFKCWSCIFPTILTYMIMWENYQNNISVSGCSPIQGTKFYSCWNSMKPGSQSETYVAAVGFITFHQLAPLGRVGLIVAMSMYLFLYLSVPFPCNYPRGVNWSWS